jgi:hypothetical protein
MATIDDRFFEHELGNLAEATGAMDDHAALGVRVSGIDYHCLRVVLGGGRRTEPE